MIRRISLNPAVGSFNGYESLSIHVYIFDFIFYGHDSILCLLAFFLISFSFRPMLRTPSGKKRLCKSNPNMIPYPSNYSSYKIVFTSFLFSCLFVGIGYVTKPKLSHEIISWCGPATATWFSNMFLCDSNCFLFELCCVMIYEHVFIFD